MKKEIWKDVKGYEGLYQISNNGNIKSLTRTITRKDGVTRRVRGGIILPTLDATGRPFINLSKNGSFKGRTIPTLMMEAFNPQYDKNSMRVVIKNRKKANLGKITLSNLECVYEKGKAGGYVTLHKGRKRIVFSTLKEAANFMGVAVNTILFGKRKHANKFNGKDVLEFEHPIVLGNDVIKTITV